MKKTLAIAAVAGLTMLGAAGQASASFERGNLFLVAYNQDTAEIGVDLGNVDYVNGLTAAPTVLATGLDFSAAGPLNTLSMGMFESNANYTTYAWDLYFATTSATVSQYSKNWSVGMNFSNIEQTIGGYYNGLPGTNVVVADPKNVKSYDMLMNTKSNAPGNYGSMNADLTVGEAKLGTEPVDMYLYHFRSKYNDYSITSMELVMSEVVAGQDWTAKLTLDNGTLTAVNQLPSSNVPVPATALLFGSSLLGLFGIRRKNS
jgi:hypothetical protein